VQLWVAGSRESRSRRWPSSPDASAVASADRGGRYGPVGRHRATPARAPPARVTPPCRFLPRRRPGCSPPADDGTARLCRWNSATGHQDPGQREGRPPGRGVAFVATRIGQLVDHQPQWRPSNLVDPGPSGNGRARPSVHRFVGPTTSRVQANGARPFVTGFVGWAGDSRHLTGTSERLGPRNREDPTTSRSSPSGHAGVVASASSEATGCTSYDVSPRAP